MSGSEWFNYETRWKDTAYSAPGNTSGEFGGFTGSTSGNPIPDANRDANGFVKSVPVGEAGISMSCQLPPTTAQRRMTWDSKLGGSNQGCATMVNIIGASGVTVSLTGRSVTYTPTNVADGLSSGPPSFRFTPVSSTDYPVNFIDRPVVDDGAVLTSEFTSIVSAACSPSPIIRCMDLTTVNRNNSPIHDPADTGYAFPNLHNPSVGSEPGTQFNEPIYTSLNRNKNKADAEWHDGVMLESLISLVTALGGHFYYNVAQNADNTFYDDVAAVCAAFSVATGKDVYIEVGNEPWNYGFTWAHQIFNEATLLGIGTEQRYIQKVISVANRFITAFTNAGVASHLKVVAAWQNYGTPTVWDSMAAFVGATDWAKITRLSVAPYYGDNSEMGIAASYTGSTATLKAAITTDIDNTITHLIGHINKAVSLGKTLITYEGGPTTILSNQAYKIAWARSSDAYDLELYYLRQLASRAATLQSGGLTHLHFNLVYPLVTGNSFSWGLKEGLVSSAAHPKLDAHTYFLANG